MSTEGNGTVPFGRTSSEEEICPKVKISRKVLNQPNFEASFFSGDRYSKTVRERVGEAKQKCTVSPSCMKSVLFKIFPFIGIMSNYKIKEDLLGDLISGFTVGIMHIPQGMAYGLLTGLSPVYGLYVSFFPVLFYFFFGSSKHVSIGTFAVISLMVGSVVDKHYQAEIKLDNNCTNLNCTNSTSNADAEDKAKISVATAVSLMAALMQLGMGFFRLGFLTIYLSDPLTRGFTTGAACHVFTSQVKHVFGLNVKRYSGALKLVYTYIDLFKNIKSTQWLPVVISVICIIVLYVTKEYINPIVKKRIKAPLPVELIVVIFGTVASSQGKFQQNNNLTVVGNIPEGFPKPSLPEPSLYSKVAGDSVAIAIVSFAISVSMVKLFAKKHDYEVDANQELVAYGISNAISSFFNCFLSSVSLSRSLVQEQVGGKTQLAGLFSCAIVLVVILKIGGLFKELPNAVLASIILVALKGMFKQFLDLKKLWHISKYDFAIWLVVFLATVLLDVDLGLAIGVGFSLLTVVFRTQRPYTAILGRLPGTDLYKDISVVKEKIVEVEGIKIFRYEASLYYANREHFVSKITTKTGVDARKLKIKQTKILKKIEKYERLAEKKGEEGNEREFIGKLQNDLPKCDIHTIIVDCSTMGYIDSVGVSTLGQVMSDYSDINVKVLLANCKAGIREMLQNAGFYERIDKKNIFLTIHDAVLWCLRDKPDEYTQLLRTMSMESEHFRALHQNSSVTTQRELDAIESEM